MCGIVAYVGKQDAQPLLIKGLKIIEYRGCDSAGVGIIDNNGRLCIRKNVGGVSELEFHLQQNPTPKSNLGIAHTRWATHGAPTFLNSHPHVDNSGRVVLVHNGIIENYNALRKNLKLQGRTFYSQTDSEVVAVLIGDIYRRMMEGSMQHESSGSILHAAVSLAITRLSGTYALAVICENEPQSLVLASHGSPLGFYNDDLGHFVSSNMEAFTKCDCRMLQDDEVVILK